MNMGAWGFVLFAVSFVSLGCWLLWCILVSPPPPEKNVEKVKKALVKAGIDENSLVIIGGELFQKKKVGDSYVLEKV